MGRCGFTSGQDKRVAALVSFAEYHSSRVCDVRRARDLAHRRSCCARCATRTKRSVRNEPPARCLLFLMARRTRPWKALVRRRRRRTRGRNPVGWQPLLVALREPHPDVAVVVNSNWRYTHDLYELRDVLRPPWAPVELWVLARLAGYLNRSRQVLLGTTSSMGHRDGH